MRIEEIRIRGFGPLRGVYAFDPERPTLVIDDNETGKSHLTAAIFAGLYGLEKARRSSKRFVESDRYRPWKGDEFGLVMIVTIGGRRLEIDRDFTTGAAVVRDALTGEDLTARYESADGKTTVGSTALGLGREQLERTAFVRQGEVDTANLSGDSEILDAVQRLMASSAADVSPARAVEALDRAGHDNFQLTFDRKLQRLRRELGVAEAEMTSLHETRERADATAAALHEANARIAGLTAAEEAELTRQKARRLAGLKERLEEAAATARELADLESKRRSLADAADVPGERRDELAEATALAAAATRDLSRIADDRARLDREMEAVRERRGSLAPFEWATADDRTALLAARDRLVSARDDNAVARAAAGDAEAEFVRRGGDPARRREILPRFTSMTAELREAVHGGFARRDELAGEQDLSAEELDRAAEDRARVRHSLMTSRIALAAGVLLAAGFGALAARLPDAAAALAGVAGVGVAIAAAAGYRWFTVARDDARIATEIERCEDEMAARDRGIEATERALRDRSEELGFDTIEDLRDGWRDFVRFERIGSDLADAERRVGDRAEAVARVRRELAPAFDRSGRPLDYARIEPADASSLADSIRNALDLAAQETRLEEALADVERHRAEREEERDRRLAVRAEILGAAGVGAAPPEDGGEPDRADREFEEAVARWDRLRRLDAAEIPAARDRLVDPGRQEAWRTEAEELAQDLGPAVDAAGDHPAPGFGSLDEIRSEARRQQDRRAELERTVGGDLDEYRRRLPELIDVAGGLREEIAEVERFRAAVDLAADAFRTIIEEGHRGWALTLNQRAGTILRRLNPRYRDVRFSHDLSFQVIENENDIVRDERSIDHQLSTGARDQVYLAVRLALVEALSGENEPLPVIFDEPLAHADDDRFAEAMRYLVGSCAAERQVIVMTCHRRRHDWLAERDPRLFRDGMQWVRMLADGTRAVSSDGTRAVSSDDTAADSGGDAEE